MVNSIKFSGIASGLDTQSIVDSMMKAQRIPLDKIHQKKQLLEWKRDDYRDVNLMLKEMDDFIFNGVYRQANLLKKSVTSSNSDFVSATAGPNAANVNYKIDNVTLATAARQQSSFEDAKQGISGSSDKKIDPTKSLFGQQGDFFRNQNIDGGNITNLFDWKTETITDKLTVSEGSKGEFQLSKRDITIDAETPITVGGKTFKVITEMSETGVLKENEVYIDQSTGKVKFGSDLAAGATFDISFTNHYLEFEVRTYNENGKSQHKNFKFDGSTSLNNMFSTINKAAAGINLFYDSGADKVVAMRMETGEFLENGNEIEFLNVKRDNDGNIIDNLDDKDKSSFFNNVLGLGTDIDGTGSDAKFTINGLETKRKSNTFTLDGVTFTLKKNSVGGSGESATINVQSDTASIVNTVKDFVNKYNEIIDKINGKLTEERHTKYSPLTEDEKTSLSEKEVEKWEKFARSGMLRRDPILSSALDRMRSTLYAEVVSNDVTRTNPNYNQLAEIGVTTTKNYLDRGKLEIDEDKLKAAIENDPEAVYQLFMADGSTSAEKGLARRLRETISSTVKSIEDRAGNSFKSVHSYTMGKQLLDFDKQIDRFEDKLATAEERYWKQFTAMEKAMQNLNNQSNQLLAQLGLGNQQ